MQVRSLTLDVKVWDPSVLNLFQSLGNTFANSVWEELLQPKGVFQVDLGPAGLYRTNNEQQMLYFSKPNPADSISTKEKFIHAKYAEKLFVRKPRENHSVAKQMWDAVRAGDKKSVYGLIVNSETALHAKYEQGTGGSSSSNPSPTLAKVMLLQEQTALGPYSGCLGAEVLHKSFSGSLNPANTSEGNSSNCNNASIEDLDGCSLLHLACETGDIGMIELLLQYGANVNAADSRSLTPLHHCINKGRTAFAKLLLSRGADPRAVDNQGRTPFQLARESNFEDGEVLGLLTESHG